jgi:hypothetical protein
MSIGTGDIIDDAMTTAKLSLDSVYIVWSEQDSDILFKRNAISFDPTINPSNTAGKSLVPSVAVSENNVMLCGLMIFKETVRSYTEEVLMVGLALEVL